MNPFWLAHIFQRGWFNHQPVIFISSPLLKLTWHFTKWAFWRCIPCWKLGGIFQPSYHQTFQVPKMEVLTYISCMDTAYVRETPPKMAWNKVQETLHFRYLKLLVILVETARVFLRIFPTFFFYRGLLPSCSEKIPNSPKPLWKRRSPASSEKWFRAVLLNTTQGRWGEDFWWHFFEAENWNQLGDRLLPRAWFLDQN